MLRIKVRHLQSALDVIAEDDQYYELVKPLADKLDQQLSEGECHPDDVLIEFV